MQGVNVSLRLSCWGTASDLGFSYRYFFVVPFVESTCSPCVNGLMKKEETTMICCRQFGDHL